MNARTLLIALALVATSGCNTFFESSPEFIENADVGLDTGAEDVSEDVSVDDGGASDAADADHADARDDVGRDMGRDVVDEDTGDAEDFSWSAPALTTRPVRSKVSLVGGAQVADGAPGFAVAFIEEGDSAGDPAEAVMQPIALPGLDLLAREADADSLDAQTDIAVGLDPNGAIVWGAVHPCLNGKVADVFYRGSMGNQRHVSIGGNSCNANERELVQIELAGGPNVIAGTRGNNPNWVWMGEPADPSATNPPPDNISSIRSDFSPVTTGDGDQTIVDFPGVDVDPNFIRSSGGRMVMMREFGGSDALIWDAVYRPASPDPPLEPHALRWGNSIVDGDLMWLTGDAYMLAKLTAQGTVEFTRLHCSVNSNALVCTDVGPGLTWQISQSDAKALRLAPFPGGFVVGMLIDGDEGISLRFDAVETSDVDAPETFVPHQPRYVDLEDTDVGEDFDVAAAFNGGELFVAGAVLTPRNALFDVGVYGSRIPDFGQP